MYTMLHSFVYHFVAIECSDCFTEIKTEPEVNSVFKKSENRSQFLIFAFQVLNYNIGIYLEQSFTCKQMAFSHLNTHFLGVAGLILGVVYEHLH